MISSLMGRDFALSMHQWIESLHVIHLDHRLL